MGKARGITHTEYRKLLTIKEDIGPEIFNKIVKEKGHLKKDERVNNGTIYALGRRQYKLILGELTRVINQTKKEVKLERIKNETKDSFVYFISDGAFIKIGKAVDVNKRLATLQSGNPRPLKVEAYVGGGYRLETIYHRRFSSLRVNNEWFRFDEEIVSEIHRLKQGKKPNTIDLEESYEQNLQETLQEIKSI